jgi:Ca2+-binding EF-hand superfamily protein
MSDAAQALRREFDRFDTDGNGVIDETEFGALVASLGVKFTPEQVQIAFLAIDVNGNRRVEYGEFAAWWTRRTS